MPRVSHGWRRGSPRTPSRRVAPPRAPLDRAGPLGPRGGAAALLAADAVLDGRVLDGRRSSRPPGPAFVAPPRRGRGSVARHESGLSWRYARPRRPARRRPTRRCTENLRRDRPRRLPGERELVSGRSLRTTAATAAAASRRRLAKAALAALRGRGPPASCPPRRAARARAGAARCAADAHVLARGARRLASSPWTADVAACSTRSTSRCRAAGRRSATRRARADFDQRPPSSPGAGRRRLVAATVACGRGRPLRVHRPRDVRPERLDQLIVGSRAATDASRRGSRAATSSSCPARLRPSAPARAERTGAALLARSFTPRTRCGGRAGQPDVARRFGRPGDARFATRGDPARAAEWPPARRRTASPPSTAGCQRLFRRIGGQESLTSRPRRLSSPPNAPRWSSLVARRAHNPEVAGSNPAPATTPTRARPQCGPARLAFRSPRRRDHGRGSLDECLGHVEEGRAGSSRSGSVTL